VNFNPALIVPELYFLLVICGLFIQSIAGEGRTGYIKWVPAAAGLGVLVTLVSQGAGGIMFWDSYRIDAMSQFFKLVVAVGLFITTLNAVTQKTLEEEKRADYYLFLCLSAWGLMLLASGVELITIYISLEISSYSLFAIVPMRARSKGAAEAGIKYILFGAVATALALYGFSYILAGQHTTYISQLALKDWSYAAQPMAVLGMVLFLGGMFYKLALFPFHFWCPDVYDGASNETAAFVATLPKLGAVVILVRLAALLKPGLEITTMLAVLGALSMTFGNLAALAQDDIKRLLGYSSVAHAGYIMLGLVSGTGEGLAAASFYVMVYLLMNLTCFWVVCRIATDGRNLKLSDLDGLHRRAPGLAFILAVSAFALVGLPPTAGFIGKLYLLTSAWNHGYNWLVIVAAVNTAIAIYYYLNMVRHAYTRDQEVGGDVAPIDRGFGFFAVGGVLAASLLWVGCMPNTLYTMALVAGKYLLP
jgi:NADH-quinone oxidoreductase subunit N